MAIYEIESLRKIEEFRKQDKEEYILEKNKIFLQWLSAKIKAGYCPIMDVKDLQTLIEQIANWYELKLPEREMIPSFHLEHYYFLDSNMKKISRYMTVD